jgi:hypothetical protein
MLMNTRHARWSILATAFAALLWGCSGGGDSKTDGAVKADSSHGDPNTQVGQFQISLVAPDTSTGTAGHTTLVGKVNDGATPELVVWETAATEGSCKLLTPRVPFCSTSCGTGACVEDETCKSYPTALSVGTVTAKGLKTAAGATTFTMDPVANNYQPPASVTLAYPAFAEGDAISLDAAGGTFSAFTLKATGIAELKLLNDSIALAENTAQNLTWTPPSSSASKVQVKLDISHHGGTKGKIVCETADSGALTLSASMLTQLIKLGVAGYPTIVVTRVASGTATISAGRVDLVISSEVEKSVTVTGLTSCTKDTECPDGQKCQTDLTCK